MNVINTLNRTHPVMLYDGDCGFCTRWIERWRKLTGEVITYEPYQKALKDFPQLTETECRRAVQLVCADGALYSGAHAVFQVLAAAGKYQFLLWAYQHIPFCKKFTEIVYQWIAHRRGFFSKIMKQKQCSL